MSLKIEYRCGVRSQSEIIAKDPWRQVLGLLLTGPKPKEIKVEIFRIDYLIRSPKVEKLGFEPVSLWG